MKRRTLIAGTIAVAGLFSLAAAAATIEDLRDDPGGDGGAETVMPRPTEEPELPDQLQLPQFLEEVLLVLLAIFLLISIAYAVTHWRRMVAYAIAVVAVVIVFLLLLEVIPLEPRLEPMEQEFGFNETAAGEDEPGAGSNGVPAISDWFPLLALLGAFALFVITMMVMAGKGERPSVTGSSDESAAGEDLTTELGAAAGRAADRLESADADDNEVYRAWREMVGLLDVGDVREATPRAFAREATRVGLDPDDVAALTELFEEVRYGDRAPSADRESTAVSLLRRIESRYTETAT